MMRGRDGVMRDSVPGVMGFDQMLGFGVMGGDVGCVQGGCMGHSGAHQREARK